MSAALLTAAEAAPLLGVTEARIRKMAQRREIGHRKDGRFLRFTQADLDDYVASTAVPRAGLVTTRPRARKS